MLMDLPAEDLSGLTFKTEEVSVKSTEVLKQTEEAGVYLYTHGKATE